MLKLSARNVEVELMKGVSKLITFSTRRNKLYRRKNDLSAIKTQMQQTNKQKNWDFAVHAGISVVFLTMDLMLSEQTRWLLYLQKPCFFTNALFKQTSRTWF